MSNPSISLAECRRVFAWLMERCQANLLRNTGAQKFLSSNGVTDESIWRAFRVGVGDGGMFDALGEEGKRVLGALDLLPRKGPSVLRDGGLLLPTFELSNPSQPVGFVKLYYGQNKHAFVTEPRGVCCGLDVVESKRVLVADSPLLGLRLAHAGCAGVVVAETPSVLPAMAKGLNGREWVLCSYKKSSLENLKGALPSDLAASVKRAHVHTTLEDSNSQTLETLGLEAPSITPHLIKRVVDFSRARVAEGQGLALLQKLGCDDAEFVQVFQLGYLPVAFESALSTSDRRALKDRIRGDSLVIPAFDEQGTIADFQSVTADGKQHNFLERPQGLIAFRIISAFQKVVVVETLSQAAGLFRKGLRNVLLFRSGADAEQNAERLKSAGVEIVGVESTEKPLSIPAILLKPVLVSHDPKTETAIFKADAAVYTVEVTVDSGTRLQVRLEQSGKVALDRFDFAVEAQRKRFATSAAMKTGVAFESIEQHLLCILDAVRELQRSVLQPARGKTRIEVQEQDRAAAVECLRRSDLLDVVAADLESLGWAGEERNKRLLYLACISRKLPHPFSVVLRAPSGCGKSMGVESIAGLTPPEDVLHCSRLTESSLYYADPDALKHKLLVVDEADALTPEVLIALRVLQTRGSISQTLTVRDAISGATKTDFTEARGPVSVLMSTTRRMDEQNLSRCFDLTVDDSKEQTERVLAIQRKLRCDPEHVGQQGRRAKVAVRHWTLQRVLESKPVLIPFADRIEFPASSVRHRREQERFLNLIEASALLHQFQRLKQKTSSGEEYILADVRDYEIACELAAEVIGRASDELSSHARDVLSLIQSSQLTTFSMDELKDKRPDWTRYRFRAGLDELQRLEVITSSGGRRGAAREYLLRPSALSSLSKPIVQLKSAQQVGALANVGEVGFANFTPRAAIG